MSHPPCIILFVDYAWTTRILRHCIPRPKYSTTAAGTRGRVPFGSAYWLMGGALSHNPPPPGDGQSDCDIICGPLSTEWAPVHHPAPWR